jgi:outer membrane immunogenic protein
MPSIPTSIGKAVCASAAILSLFGISTATEAADMSAPAYKVPPPPPPPSWTGLYVGLNAGGAWARSDVTYVPPGFPFTAVVDAYSAIGSGQVSSTGATAGGQAGYNYQWGLAVFGLEGDINAFFLRGDFTQAGAPPGNILLTSNASIKTDWLATVRGRLGLAPFNGVLAYVTGGIAVTDFNFRQSNNYADFLVSNFSSTQTKSTWTVGGGLEYAFVPNWSAKIEYLHMDFGSISGIGPPIVADTGTHSYSANLKANLVRGGINYHF